MTKNNDKQLLSTFIISNNYPAKIEDAVLSLEKTIKYLEGKGNITLAKKALSNLKRALIQLDKLPQ